MKSDSQSKSTAGSKTWRGRLRLFFLCCLVGLVILFVVAWIYIRSVCYQPADMEEVERAQAQLESWVRESAAQTQPNQPVETESDISTTTTQPTENQPVDFFKQIKEIDVTGSTIFSEIDGQYGINAFNPPIMGGLVEAVDPGETTLDSVIEPEGQILREKIVDRTRTLIASWHWNRMKSNTRSGRGRVASRHERFRPSPADIPVETRRPGPSLSEALDRVETFLLDQTWRIEGFDNAPTHSPFYYNRLCLMVLGRAYRQGEADLAQRLLFRYIESLRIVRPVVAEAYGRYHPLDEVYQVILIVSKYDPDSGSVLAQLTDPIGGLRIDKELIPVLIASKMQRTKQQTFYNQRKRISDQVWGYSTMDLFLGGIVEDVQMAVLKPMSNLYDQMAIAIQKGDIAEGISAEKRLIFWGRLLDMNIRTPGYFLGADFASIHTSWLPYMTHMADMLSGAMINDHMDFLDMALAAERYRTDQGRYPESVRELVPQYLGERFIADREESWEILHLERFHYPLLGFRGKDDPYTQATKRYRDENGQMPSSLADLEPYLSESEEDLGDDRDWFVWFEARPVFSRIRPDRYNRNVWREIGIARDRDFSTPPTREELQKLRRAAENGPTSIRVDFLTPQHPLIAPEILDWLDASDPPDATKP